MGVGDVTGPLYSWLRSFPLALCFPPRLSSSSKPSLSTWRLGPLGLGTGLATGIATGGNVGTGEVTPGNGAGATGLVGDGAGLGNRAASDDRALSPSDQNFFSEPGDSDIRFAPESRDAQNNMVGFLHVFRFVQDRYLLRLGYQRDTEASKGTAFTYRGNRLQTGGEMVLPWQNLAVRMDYEWHGEITNMRKHFLPTMTAFSRPEPIPLGSCFCRCQSRFPTP
jgi:hypothetical protein